MNRFLCFVLRPTGAKRDAAAGTISRRRSLPVVLVLLITAAPALAQSAAEAPSPVGRWVTIDDERNEPRSIVRIYEDGGLLYARVDSIYLREGEPPDPICKRCKGERKDQRIMGMLIMWNMKPKGGKWSGGRILDPEKGKTYRSKIWLKDGKLRVRGYLGPFYRTQTWLRAE